jgi:glucokinase
MVLAVDIGATKTLLAAFTEEGKLEKEFKFPTPKTYKAFLKEITKAYRSEFGNSDFRVAAVAVPALLNRETGVAIEFGNLNWKNVPIKADLKDTLEMPVEIENDTKLGGLSEARLLGSRYKKVMYLTVSTGIGEALIEDGRIDATLEDSEAGQMIVLHEGKLQRWEDFASGHALVKKYGQPASEIEEPEIWKDFSDGLAQGLGQLLAVLQPEVVVIGGGVGAHFEKFGGYLVDYLETKYKAKLVAVPPIIKAKRPEEAVAYGCYELVKQ